MIYGFAILVLWTISFFFAGIEAGLLSVDPVRLRSQVKQGSSAAMRLDRLTKNPERLLVTVLLVTNFANILGLLLMTRLLVSQLGSPGFVWAIVIALPIYLFVLSVLPKSLFRRFPFRALARLGGLLEGVSILLWPVLEIGERIRNLLLPRRAESGRLFIAREELKQIAVQSEREGSLTSTERAMIHNVVDFRNVRASDVMCRWRKRSPFGPILRSTKACASAPPTMSNACRLFRPKAKRLASSTPSTSCSTRTAASRWRVTCAALLSPATPNPPLESSSACAPLASASPR